MFLLINRQMKGWTQLATLNDTLQEKVKTLSGFPCDVTEKEKLANIHLNWCERTFESLTHLRNTLIASREDEKRRHFMSMQNAVFMVIRNTTPPEAVLRKRPFLRVSVDILYLIGGFSANSTGDAYQNFIREVNEQTLAQVEKVTEQYVRLLH